MPDSKMTQETISLIVASIEHKYQRVERMRTLAGSEEDYLIIKREIDRVKAQIMHAHIYNAEATLSFLEWFAILDRFDWKCAYCRKRPHQIMSHILPQHQAGTTAKNCVPACHSCVRKAGRKTLTI